MTTITTQSRHRYTRGEEKTNTPPNLTEWELGIRASYEFINLRRRDVFYVTATKILALGRDNEGRLMKIRSHVVNTLEKHSSLSEARIAIHNIAHTKRYNHPIRGSQELGA